MGESDRYFILYRFQGTTALLVEHFASGFVVGSYNLTRDRNSTISPKKWGRDLFEGIQEGDLTPEEARNLEKHLKWYESITHERPPIREAPQIIERDRRTSPSTMQHLRNQRMAGGMR